MARRDALAAAPTLSSLALPPGNTVDAPRTPARVEVPYKPKGGAAEQDEGGGTGAAQVRPLAAFGASTEFAKHFRGLPRIPCAGGPYFGAVVNNWITSASPRPLVAALFLHKVFLDNNSERQSLLASIDSRCKEILR